MSKSADRRPVWRTLVKGGLNMSRSAQCFAAEDSGGGLLAGWCEENV
jgi:hypothetical protein